MISEVSFFITLLAVNSVAKLYGSREKLRDYYAIIYPILQKFLLKFLREKKCGISAIS